MPHPPARADEPWLLGVIPSQLLRHVAYFRPRLGLLTQLQAN